VQRVSRQDWQRCCGDIASAIEQAVAPDGQGDAWGPKKDALTKWFRGQEKQAVGTDPTLQTAEQARSQLTGQMNEAWTKEILSPFLPALQENIRRLSMEGQAANARKRVAENMPQFLYFGEYEVLDSAIYMPEFVQRVKADNKSPKTRVQRALFKHVGADIDELAKLGHHEHGKGFQKATQEQVDKLTILADSAQQAMTKKFSDWWEQRRHTFNYQFNGDYFRIWVSDDLDPAKVELEQRSQGMRYFFSFYLVFLVEADEGHVDCVLLLDEPGLHLHGTAQAKLLTFFEKLSGQNQLFYTTHSPFMIDGAHLERARAVYETPEGTRVSADVWPRDKDTLFPLQAALGYSVCQTLFVARRQVLVEGLTDYMLLSVLNERLRADGKPALGDEIVLLPMGGTTNLAPLGSLLAGHNVELAILLDSDTGGDSAIKKLRSVIADVDSRCVQIADAMNDMNVRELEQLMPEGYYIEALKRAYSGEAFDFVATEQAIPNVVDRVEAWLKRNAKPKLEKWRPIQQVVADINAGSPRVPDKLYAAASTVLAKLNAVFEAGAM
jgi:predicted ATP-dependent endonuclease of OLD family